MAEKHDPAEYMQNKLPPFTASSENSLWRNFSLEPEGGTAEEFRASQMKRPNAPASKQDSLARKRALIRSLIEQHGWAVTPARMPNQTRSDAGSPPAQGMVIPFPTLGK